jgi:hypothetical protein
MTIYYLKTLGVEKDKALELIVLNFSPVVLENCLLPIGIPCNLWTPRGWQHQEPLVVQ